MFAPTSTRAIDWSTPLLGNCRSIISKAICIA